MPPIREGEVEYLLGCLRPTEKRIAHLEKVFADKRLEPIPRSKWQPCDFGHLTVNTDDQGSLGSCASNGSTGVLEGCRSQQGQDAVLLSYRHLYGQITQSNTGTRMSDNLAYLQKFGVCPMVAVPNHPELIVITSWYRRNWPANWQPTAKRYQPLKIVWTEGDFDLIATAVQRGWFSVIALYVGNNFRVDSQGWLGRYTGGKGGHALLCVGLAKRGNEWGLILLNSWGEDWGVKRHGRGGWCIAGESYFGRDNPFDDSWSACSAVDPTGDGDLTRSTETAWGLSP